MGQSLLRPEFNIRIVCMICGAHSGTGAGFSPRSCIYPYEYHSTDILFIDIM